MTSSSSQVWERIRRGLILGAAGIAAGLALIVIAIAALSAGLDAGYLRGPFVRFLAAHAQRPVKIDGALRTHFWSLHPQVIAEHVTLGNPSWTPAGVTAQIDKLDITVRLPWFGHAMEIQRLEMDGTTLHLERDRSGHANWQRTNPDEGPQGSPPLIRSLSMRRAHVVLDDELRHLRFEGTVSAGDVKGDAGSPPLRIEGAGQLNGRADTFEITADPLESTRAEQPYGFRYWERSSGSRLTGNGALLRTFDFDHIDTTFETAGEDLDDLYFLTGVKFINTAPYRFSGKLARRGTHTDFTDLALTFGQSAVTGKLSIESGSGRAKFESDVEAQILRMSDIGARAAGREHDPEAGKLLLPRANLSPEAVRRGDWVVHLRARRIDVGRVSLQEVAGTMTIERGILTVAPFSAEFEGGKLTARLKVDASTDNPNSDLDLKLTGMQLARLHHKDDGPPPVEGALQARIEVKGRGRSIHEAAANANGSVTAVVTRGMIRASLAELAGIDLRGLGLILAKDKTETGIRCVVAGFKAHDGILDTQSMVVDTDPVLITGAGQLHLDTETLDFALQGHPKGLRLFRLHTPVLLRGTLVHPAIGVEKRKAAVQAAGAAALSVVLTPLAGMLAFVDPGLAKDADCASLREQVAASAR